MRLKKSGRSEATTFGNDCNRTVGMSAEAVKEASCAFHSKRRYAGFSIKNVNLELGQSEGNLRRWPTYNVTLHHHLSKGAELYATILALAMWRQTKLNDLDDKTISLSRLLS